MDRRPVRTASLALAAALIIGATSTALAQDEEPKRGGEINYITFTNVEVFNPRMLPEGVNFQVGELVNRGLTEVDNEGIVYAELAEKVPDPADGDVSEDLLTVTWTLKEGLVWSDGEPLTSDDLRFTWEVCGDPANACAKTAGLTQVESVETPDDRTIILNYSEPFFEYKQQFRDGVLPRHSADVGAPEDIVSWPYNQTLDPNLGPFSVVDFQPGISARLERNENFYLADEGKPYLDAINIVMRDSVETFRQAVLNGEADVSPWLTQPAPAQVTELVDRGISIGSGSSPYFNRYVINLWDRDDPTRTTPHPILGDVRVREAIIRGTNTDNVIFNWNVPGVYEAEQNPSRLSMHGGENLGCDIETVPYEPERAMALLEEAGWVDTDGDGIREKDGQKMTLSVSTYTGFGQEDNVVVWVDELKNLGIEGIVDPIDVGLFYSSWADGSPIWRGDFDLAYFDHGGEFGGPQNEVEIFYGSTMLPSEDNAIGRNFNGVQDAEVDAMIAEAAQTMDAEQRAAIHCDIHTRVQQELWADHWNGLIPNFQMVNPNLKGWTDGELYVWFGSESENWWLDE